ncbi:MAG TPA: carboxypeptidase-like regulatory domain-containing protein, partial [Herpetosiphonaceae bacterium]|nr:carboxypeptidase-like regulatory domain-containing protein [Herpetosiphonaceae bacterium]
MQPRFRRRWWQALLLLLGALVAWLLVTDNSRIWPYRNTIQYYVFRASQRFIRSDPTAAGILVGSVEDTSGTPIPDARVLVSAWDGTTWSGTTDASGRFRITNVPAGSHVVVAGAAGYEHWSTREALLNRVHIRANTATELAIKLAPAVPQERLLAANWRLGPPRRVQIAAP